MTPLVSNKRAKSESRKISLFGNSVKNVKVSGNNDQEFSFNFKEGGSKKGIKETTNNKQYTFGRKSIKKAKLDHSRSQSEKSD